eukprot:gnl/MRDRNA2_/MRDRNA2_96254_c0_seq1.p1 gnl/MRDRNA2_/MRDRNA2_96254_c0~~gnl/MRDRNA2_/MRDRNA2_96254_c0_seq1.p1  ORF type:complete len:308 (-),score=60.84 gnl/MRDRNA2_/MRDRNA2_96254_c0_seq1:76-999(-)
MLLDELPLEVVHKILGLLCHDSLAPALPALSSTSPRLQHSAFCSPCWEERFQSQLRVATKALLKALHKVPSPPPPDTWDGEELLTGALALTERAPELRQAVCSLKKRFNASFCGAAIPVKRLSFRVKVEGTASAPAACNVGDELGHCARRVSTVWEVAGALTPLLTTALELVTGWHIALEKLSENSQGVEGIVAWVREWRDDLQGTLGQLSQSQEVCKGCDRTLQALKSLLEERRALQAQATEEQIALAVQVAARLHDERKSEGKTCSGNEAKVQYDDGQSWSEAAVQCVEEEIQNEIRIQCDAEES